MRGINARNACFPFEEYTKKMGASLVRVDHVN